MAEQLAHSLSLHEVIGNPAISKPNSTGVLNMTARPSLVVNLDGIIEGFAGSGVTARSLKDWVCSVPPRVPNRMARNPAGTEIPRLSKIVRQRSMSCSGDCRLIAIPATRQCSTKASERADGIISNAGLEFFVFGKVFPSSVKKFPCLGLTYRLIPSSNNTFRRPLVAIPCMVPSPNSWWFTCCPSVM
jgi:hypothetical protein